MRRSLSESGCDFNMRLILTISRDMVSPCGSLSCVLSIRDNVSAIVSVSRSGTIDMACKGCIEKGGRWKGVAEKCKYQNQRWFAKWQRRDPGALMPGHPASIGEMMSSRFPAQIKKKSRVITAANQLQRKRQSVK